MSRKMHKLFKIEFNLQTVRAYRLQSDRERKKRRRK